MPRSDESAAAGTARRERRRRGAMAALVRHLRSSVAATGSVARAASTAVSFRLVRLVGPEVGLRVADAVGATAAVLPGGRREVRRMRYAFPDRDDHGAIVRSRAALRRRNHVVAASMVGAEHDAAPAARRGSCPPATAELLDGDGSFVLATGHFALELLLPLTDPRTLDREIQVVFGMDPGPGGSASGRLVGRRTVDAYNQGMIARGCTMIERGDSGAIREAVRALSGPGLALAVFADVAMPDGRPSRTVRRDFAGRIDIGFDTGVARLARLAGVPILVCTARCPRHAPGAATSDAVLDWSAPVWPAVDSSGDADVTHRVLDVLESAIGRDPELYGLPIGGRRRWDAAGGTWTTARGAR